MVLKGSPMPFRPWPKLFFERSPVIFITGASTLKRADRGGFKEIAHNRVAEPITKYTASVTSGERIAEAVDKAYEMAVNGNPGPVHVSIPVDLLYSSYEETQPPEERPFQLSRREVHRISPDPDDLAQLARVLAEAKRPVAIAGHGVWWSGAEDELETTAIRFGMPVYDVPYHQKALDLHSPISLGLVDIHLNPPSQEALSQADVILVVGCRLDNLLNFGNPPLFPECATLICVNGSALEVADNHVADIRILGDPSLVLKGLSAAADSGGFHVDHKWLEENKEGRAEVGRGDAGTAGRG